MLRCPGQDSRFWKPRDVFEVKCPSCGAGIEFFKDEPVLKCRVCDGDVRNPRIDKGCLQWCRYAAQCSSMLSEAGTGSLYAILIDEMKKVFGADERRIKHALTVLDYAERIWAAEGGDPLVVRAAAILHDIGIHEAERKYGSSAGKFQQIEGPPIANEVLRKYDISDANIGHILRIIANHHSGRDIDTLEFRIVWDADWLVNFSEVFAGKPPATVERAVRKIFRTGKGREIATELFIAKPQVRSTK